MNKTSLEPPRLWEYSYLMHGNKASSRDRFPLSGPDETAKHDYFWSLVSTAKVVLLLRGKIRYCLIYVIVQHLVLNRVLHNNPRKVGL